MPTGLGVLAKCGVVAGSSWGEAWSAVTAMVPFSDEAIAETIGQIEDNSLEGSAGKRASDQGLIELNGALNADIDYYNFGPIWKAAFGVDTSEVYTFEDELGDMLRMEFEKSVSRWRIDSLKIGSFSISGNKGDALKLSLDLLCRSFTRSATAFPAISISNYSRVVFSNTSATARIRIGDQDNALASGDEMGLESFKIDVDNALKADDYTNQQRYCLEPIRGGKRDVKLTIKLPRYSADTFQDWKAAGTKLQADFYFTDGTKTFLIEIPEFIIYEGFDSSIPGPDVIFQEGVAQCFTNTDNTPMTAISDEMRLTIT